MTADLGPWSGLGPVPSPARPNAAVRQDGPAPVAVGRDDDNPVGIPTVLAATAAGTMAKHPIGRVAPPFDDDRIRRICIAAGRAEFGAIFSDL